MRMARVCVAIKIIAAPGCTLMSGVSYSVMIGQSLQGATPRAPDAQLGQTNARHQTERGSAVELARL